MSAWKNFALTLAWRCIPEEASLLISKNRLPMNCSTIWVTGASAGIGRAVVHRFASQGQRVLALARRADRLSELESAYPDLVKACALDLTDASQLEECLKALQPPWSEPDILVNNAGAAFGLEMAQEARWSDWQAMISLNVESVLHLTHWVLPGMTERNRGHIVNLGSVAGTYPYKGGGVYGGSKAFLEQFSLGLRCDLLGKQVRVTNIEPGATQTEFASVRFRGDREKAAQVYAGFPALQPEDIAESIYWCTQLPPHVNINRMEIMPTMQAPAGFVWHRE
jgi:3-hydroxy acid dehydrogenase/malonic semialdehyde reductase